LDLDFIKTRRREREKKGLKMKVKMNLIITQLIILLRNVNLVSLCIDLTLALLTNELKKLNTEYIIKFSFFIPSINSHKTVNEAFLSFFI
jgi:hypothetical protein